MYKIIKEPEFKSYDGPSCKFAKIRPGQTYAKLAVAERDLKKLQRVSDAEFYVVDQFNVVA